MYTTLRFKFAVLTSAVFVVAGFVPLSAHAVVTASTMTRFTGQTSDSAGRASTTGDLNNDGYDEIIIGTDDNSNAGSVYIQYGSATAVSATAMSSSTMIELTGATADDEAGISLATGDINNDGFDDLLVGADKDDTAATNAGAFYLIYGSATALTSSTLSTVGVKYSGETSANGLVGTSVAAGDMNGDGYDDMIIGSSTNNDGGAVSGAVLLIYGQAAVFTSTTLSAATVVQFTGAAGDSLGQAVASGNINGDAYDDILMAAPNNDLCALGTPDDKCGAVFLVYGQATALTSATLSGSNISFRGEAISDGLQGLQSGDVNGDGYDDIVMGSTGNDDAASGAGAVYVAYGQSAALTSASVSTLAEFTGKAASDQTGVAINVADINNDTYADMFISATGNDDGANTAGAVWLVYGQSAAFSTGAATALASAGTEITGTTASETFGRSITLGDFNGDAYLDLLVGAHGYSSSAGAGYVAYLAVDADEDGVLGTTGQLLTSTDCSDTDATVSANQTYYADADGDGVANTATTTSVCSSTAPDGYVAANDPVDCNDADATVSANQTYYADADEDGLGDADSTTAVCSSTAPDGYIDNSDDTNDTIPNNGVEIGGDAVDNDGDGSTDEVNTVDENGAHPYYSTLDPADADAVATEVTAVSGVSAGTIEVTYADGSVYSYSAFSGYTGTAATIMNQYQGTGYVVAVHPKGKEIALVNVYDGTVYKRITLSDKAYKTVSMKILDVRKDGSEEAVVTAKSKKNKVGVYIIKVKTADATITKKGTTTFKDKRVVPSKTLAKKKTIVLKNKNGKVVHRLTVTKKYKIKQS